MPISGTKAFGAAAAALALATPGPERAETRLGHRIDRTILPPLRAAAPLTGFLDYRASAAHDASVETARLLNARVPFAGGPIQAAAPFFLSGAASDQMRAVDCLAAAAYYEAGSDEAGQRAVAQVVLNRLRHPAFQRSVCAVIFAGSERATGCQFTFTCDGALTRYRPSPQAWRQAQRVALEALQGRVDPEVGEATHYHTEWVHPVWSDALDKIAAVDAHLFFQAKGTRPGDFSAPYGGAEPTIARLAFLSSAHGPALPMPAPDLIPPPPPATAVPPEPAGERLPDTARATDPDIFLVTLDAHADPESFLRSALLRCAGKAACKFIGWTDARKRSAQFPIPGSAIDAISFSFNRNQGEADKPRWNCGEFPRSDPGQCLRRGS